MKIKRNTGYAKSVENRPIKLVLDINTLDIMCRYVLSSSSFLKVTHLVNLRKLISVLDKSTYEKDPEKNKRIDFLIKALEAKIDYHLTDINMIMTHIGGGLTFTVDFIDFNNIELNKNELMWVNQLISETLQYQFIYDRMPQLQDIITRFNASDYLHRGGIVKEFEAMVDSLKNDFRHSKINDNSIDMTFSLREGIFEDCVTDVYNMVTNPNRRLICGMQGLNELVGGGFESGRVYMLFGIGGVGKSLTLLNLMTQMKKYNKNYKCKDPTKRPCIVLLTMENTVVETITRLFSMSDPNSGQMGDYTVQEVINILRQYGQLVLNDDSPIDIIIKYKPNKSVDTSYMYTMCDDLEDDGYEVICFIQDHVKRIRSVYNSPDLRIELGDIVNEMKAFAAEKDIPVISVSHLNRDAIRVIEDGAAKGANADITRKLGMSNIGESILMADNLDCGIIINLDFDQDGNRYLCYSLVKMRDKVARDYICQPFVFGSTIMLVEDVGTIPMFKESLHMAPSLNHRNTSIRTTTANNVVNIGNLFNDDIMDSGSFSNARMPFDLNEIDSDITAEDKYGHPIESPIYYVDASKPDMSKLDPLKAKLMGMKAPMDELVS